MQDEYLRGLGLKVTVPRVKILTILETAERRHWSAEALYDELRSQGHLVGLATVYRVLTQFEEAGLVKRHHFEGNFAVFELEREEDHDHLVCVKCAMVTEFVDQTIEDCQVNIAERNGFKITDHNLVIYGFCRDCQLIE